MNTKKHVFFVTKIFFSFRFPTNHFCFISSSTVRFFIANDENEVHNYIESHHEEENNVIFQNYLCQEEDYKIYVMKNGILCFKSAQKSAKYFKPDIIKVPYVQKMLLASNLIQEISVYNKNNINIFIKNVSYTAFLIFLRVMENPDEFIFKMNLVDLLDILKIITMLDIGKSNERDFLLKNIIKNLLYGIESHPNIFDFLNQIHNFSFSEIDRFLVKDMLIFFIDITCFNKNSAERFMIPSTNKGLNLKDSNFFSSYNLIKKVTQNKFYIKIMDEDIFNLYKSTRLSFFLNTWKFLLRIASFEYFYILVTTTKSVELAILLFRDTRLNCSRIYIVMKINNILITDLLNTIFSGNIQILKISGYITPEMLEDIFKLLSNVQKLTIKCLIVTFEILSLFINFARMNLTKSFKLRCVYYEFGYTDLNFLRTMPINLLFYVDLIKIDSQEVFIDKNFIPYMSHYSLSINETDIMIPCNIFLFDCFRLKECTIEIKDIKLFPDIDKFTINSLMNFKTLKYLTLKNIRLSNELFTYILESNILVYLNISNFINQIDFKKILKKNTLNNKLRYIILRNSRSCFNNEILEYLRRFERLTALSLENIKIEFTRSKADYLFSNFYSFFKKTFKKNCLTRLEIISPLPREKTTDLLDCAAHFFELSKLNELIYKVNKISDADCNVFSQMNALQAIVIQIYDSNEYNLRNLLNNRALYNSIDYIDLTLKKIKYEDIIMIMKFTKLKYLFISCEHIDYQTTIRFKKKYLKNAKFVLKQPTREKRPEDVNNYLYSEFNDYF